MPWLKAGDNAATHPRVLRVATLGAEPGLTNEVFGFVFRCALQSAGHLTDYVVDAGTAWMLGGPRTQVLLDAAIKVGLLTPTTVPGVEDCPGYRIIEDPEFIHIRLKAEVEWERQQRSDTSNPMLTVPVRLRDGDACRYCGKIVQWAARKGARAGTYDHREAGKPARVDTFVVSCGGCNSGRGNDPAADDRYPLRPIPTNPYYSARTAEFLQRHGYPVVVNIDPDRLGDQPSAPATPPPAGPRPRRPPRPSSMSHLQILLPRAGAGRVLGRVGSVMGRYGTKVGTTDARTEMRTLAILLAEPVDQTAADAPHEGDHDEDHRPEVPDVRRPVQGLVSVPLLL